MSSFEKVMQFTRGVSASAAFEDAECEAFYNALMHVPADGIVVEIGCQLGRSSSIIAQLQPLIGFHAIHIDPYTEQPDYLKGWCDMMWRVGPRNHQEFTLLCMRTEQAEWLLSRLGPIDFAFVDGDHEYPSVMIDLKLVADRVKVGGLLTAHDYANLGLPGVKQALNEYIDGKWLQRGVYGSLGVWQRI